MYKRQPQEPVLLRDAYGEVAIYLLPYLKPALVRHSAPEAEIATYQDAVSYALQQWTVPPSRRNVLVAHQFVTGGTTSESEEHSVGGLDQVSGELFDPFDYVALGHLHRAQSVGPVSYTHLDVYKRQVMMTTLSKGPN